MVCDVRYSNARILRLLPQYKRIEMQVYIRRSILKRVQNEDTCIYLHVQYAFESVLLLLLIDVRKFGATIS